MVFPAVDTGREGGGGERNGGEDRPHRFRHRLRVRGGLCRRALVVTPLGFFRYMYYIMGRSEPRFFFSSHLLVVIVITPLIYIIFLPPPPPRLFFPSLSLSQILRRHATNVVDDDDDDGQTKTPGITITQKQATMAMSALSVVVLIWLLNHIFWMALGTSGFLCGVHCLLRDASMHKDESDRVVMQGDLSLDDRDGDNEASDEAQFLNSSAGGMA